MDIRTAAIASASKDDVFIRNRAHTYTLYVAAGSVFRSADESGSGYGLEVELDARECMSDGWYLVNGEGVEIPAPATPTA